MFDQNNRNNANGWKQSTFNRNTQNSFARNAGFLSKSNDVYEQRMNGITKQDIQKFRPTSASSTPVPPRRPFEQQTWAEKQRSIAWFLQKKGKK